MLVKVTTQTTQKTGEPEEKPSEQGREPTTNSTHLLHRVQDSNPGHIGRRRARSPLRHPCSPIKTLLNILPHSISYISHKIVT